MNLEIKHLWSHKCPKKWDQYTLIALIITIIVLLIMAGVTITQLTENGMFSKSKMATSDSKLKAYYEKVELEFGTARLDYYGNKSQSFANVLEGILNKKDWVQAIYNEASENEKVILTLETKDGYIIVINVDNSIPKVAIDYDESGKIEYNAVIIYNANGGEGTMDSQQAMAGKNTMLRANTFTREGYAFIGWSTSTNKSDKVENNKLKLGKNETEKTVYAIWVETCSINFNANEGTGEMATISVAKGEPGKLPANTFSKEGYFFFEWNTEANGSGTVYKDSDNITPENNLTLYAQWTDKITLTGESLLKVVEDNTFVNNGIYNIGITGKTEVYTARVYNITPEGGTKVVTTEEEYGEESDVATSTDFAKNMIIVKINGNLTIEDTGKMTAIKSSSGYGGPKGMLIYCTGTLTNKGEISMTARGAKAEGQDVYLWQNTDKNYELIPIQGALEGTEGINRQTGGGRKRWKKFSKRNCRNFLFRRYWWWWCIWKWCCCKGWCNW